MSFSIEGITAEGDHPSATVVTIDPGWAEVFQVALFQGRTFQASDRLESPPVVLVNEAMAQAYFEGRNPIGERIRIQDTSREVVGVVGNVREDIFQFDGKISQPVFYVPQAQSPARQVGVALRASGDPLALTGPAREAILRIDPKLSAAEFKSMDDFVAQFFVGMRLLNGLLSGFGALALFLAAIGIYGVIAFSVSRRTHEIGLRMALGASYLDVLRLVVREGLVLIAIGFAVGIPGIFLVSRVIAAALSGISPFALSTSVAIGVGLFAVALLACYVPARKAASLHPSMALRTE
jgi:putative ABC transport system permease protein